MAACYGQGQFWNDDPAKRSQADRWMDWSQTSLQPDFLMGVFWGFYRTPEHLRDRAAVAAKVAACAAHMRVLDPMLADQPYLDGEELTLADIPAGTALYRYFGLEIERPSVPHVEAWYRRLQARSAYRKQVMVPFGDLKGKLDY
ncbi:glutathione binding-like protein [Rhodopila sp.]|uniref:glutathione binding-like protein n=1 Tax=Rhodopila sp. TaxID=2480087 RepID=UPI003D0DF26C